MRIDGPSEAELNKLGEQGWALISVFSEARRAPYDQGYVYHTVAWLQRQIDPLEVTIVGDVGVDVNSLPTMKANVDSAHRITDGYVIEQSFD